MPMKTTLLTLALLTGYLVAKEPVIFNELKLEDGTVLKAAKVLRVDPDGLHMEHHEGVCKVKFEYLPENVQQQFEFDRNSAEKFRTEQDSAREAREAAERKTRVDGILAKQRSEQDEDLRRGREEFFALIQTGEYSYPQLENILLDSIASLKAAGREDLAATLEDDRKLLRQREVSRPPESLRKERDDLLTRVRDLENQLAQLKARPVDDPNVRPTTTIWPIFVDRPVFIPQTVVVDRPASPQPHCPPTTDVLPRLTPYSPASHTTNNGYRPAAPQLPSTPAIPQAPRVIPQSPAPAVPQMPHAAPPSSGAQIHGAHLWKKN